MFWTYKPQWNGEDLYNSQVNIAFLINLWMRRVSLWQRKCRQATELNILIAVSHFALSRRSIRSYLSDEDVNSLRETSSVLSEVRTFVSVTQEFAHRSKRKCHFTDHVLKSIQELHKVAYLHAKLLKSFIKTSDKAFTIHPQKYFLQLRM